MKKAIKEKNNSITLNLSVSTNKPQREFKEYNKWRKTLKIDLKEKPKKNKANKELINYLSNFFSLSKEKIAITKGKTSKQKTVELKNLDKSIATEKIKKELNEK